MWILYISFRSNETTLDTYTDVSQFYPQEYMSYKSKYLYLFNRLLYPRHLKEKLACSIHLNTNNTYKCIIALMKQQIYEKFPNLVKLDVFIKLPVLRKAPSHRDYPQLQIPAVMWAKSQFLCPSFIICKMGMMIFVERIKRVKDFKCATMVLGTSKKAYKISDLFFFSSIFVYCSLFSPLTSFFSLTSFFPSPFSSLRVLH